MPPEVGRYALETEVVTQSQVPIFGRNQVVTRTRALLTIEDRDGRREARQRTCSVDAQSTSRTQTVIPDAFVAGLRPVVFEVVVEPGGFRLERGVQRVGLDGSAVSLPRDASHPAVVDTDRDGRPGATVRLDVPLVGAVDVYVVQRTEMRLTGSTTARGAHGQVDVVDLEQRTLGASHPLFKVSPKLEPVPGAGRFRMNMLSDDATCADVGL
jgi:hypothetical protein